MTRQNPSQAEMIENILRFLEGDLPEAEQARLQQWREENPQNRNLFEQVERIWRAYQAAEPEAVPDVGAAWKRVAGRIGAEASGGQSTFSLGSATAPNTRRFRAWWMAAAAVMVLLVVAIGYYLSLPPYYDLARLSAEDRAYLSSATRGGAPALPTEYVKGAEVLLEAQRRRLGLLPVFDRQRVVQAIAYLEAAYRESTDPVLRNKCAYYLAKGYLMAADRPGACRWLNTILASAATAYQQEARTLFGKLGCPSSDH